MGKLVVVALKIVTAGGALLVSDSGRNNEDLEVRVVVVCSAELPG